MSTGRLSQTRNGREPGPWLALLVAPLAGPAAMWAGSVVVALAERRMESGYAHPVAAALVILFAFELFGIPLVYPTTWILLWPWLSWLRRRGRLMWWTAVGPAALLGAALLPLYLHALDPNGTFDFFPGAGAVAGAAVAGTFWFLFRDQPRSSRLRTGG